MSTVVDALQRLATVADFGAWPDGAGQIGTVTELEQMWVVGLTLGDRKEE